MPRKPKPPVVLYGVPSRKRRHLCPHCLGYTRAVKGQKLEEAIAIHELTCPAIARVKPTHKKGPG